MASLLGVRLGAGRLPGLAAMKQDLHDRLWNAQQRWFALREEGATKRGLKLQGLRCGDPNRFTRNILFTGGTRRSYEETLKSFLEFAHERSGIQKLEDLGKRTSGVPCRWPSTAPLLSSTAIHGTP